MRSGNFIQKRQKLKAINRIVNAISSNGWFEHPQANRAWLRDYLSTLYDRGLVLHDELVACGIAAARHRFSRHGDDIRTKNGVFGPEDIALMSSIFCLANQNPTLAKDSEEAQQMARRVMRLYEAGCQDPDSALRLLKSI
ncbi:hypothetical protein [Mycoplana dimorpha]|uniref:Uncharacterized protein n=1 Tax=Mycoplana dimorpha TaxID=28320 RepID=A0A2T5AYZ7_MYCDI|nr:hypothetical protein [Mycoplana dimorpha]PTM91956.1 hypothetical protein C7449_1081 [Mycoplana dimorpha]